MAYLYGTAGWSYADWEGRVYPSPKPRDFNPLAFLSRDFDFVEVNTTFYRIPSLKLTQGWARKTENIDGFSFWIKIHQDFTHRRVLQKGEVESFKNALQPLEEAHKLTGLLAQFPYSFKNDSRGLDFLKNLRDHFGEYTLAVEFRHRGWSRDEVLGFFRENRLVWVNIDQPVISQSLPLTDYITHPEISYFRLHGRNRATWFADKGRDARYDYDYSALELIRIAEKIKKLKELAGKIFVSGNNHYKGSAVKNLKELKGILKES